MRTNALTRLRSPLFYLGGQLYPSVNSTRPRGQLHPSRRLTLPVWEVNSTRPGGQLYPSARSTVPVWGVNSTRLRRRLYSSGRSTQPVWEVNSTRLGGQLNPSGRSTQLVWEVNSTRLGGQLYSVALCSAPVLTVCDRCYALRSTVTRRRSPPASILSIATPRALFD
eukprot:SAG25_NODE_247_length_11077_cov_5.635088_15_plen_167_part_00